MKKDIQAKNVPTEKVLDVIGTLQKIKGGWAYRSEVEEYFPGVPSKVLLAKLRSLIKSKAITGCACGCRGDFDVPTSE